MMKKENCRRCRKIKKIIGFEYCKYCATKLEAVLNEFGLKTNNNRLCLVCREYKSKKNWSRHLKTHEYTFRKSS